MAGKFACACTSFASRTTRLLRDACEGQNNISYNFWVFRKENPLFLLRTRSFTNGSWTYNRIEPRNHNWFRWTWKFHVIAWNLTFLTNTTVFVIGIRQQIYGTKKSVKSRRKFLLTGVISNYVTKCLKVSVTLEIMCRIQFVGAKGSFFRKSIFSCRYQ